MVRPGLAGVSRQRSIPMGDVCIPRGSSKSTPQLPINNREKKIINTNYKNSQTNKCSVLLLQVPKKMKHKLGLLTHKNNWTILKYFKQKCQKTKHTQGTNQTKKRERTDPKLSFLKSPASCSHWWVGGVPSPNQPMSHQSAAGTVTEAILPGRKTQTHKPQAIPEQNDYKTNPELWVRNNWVIMESN